MCVHVIAECCVSELSPWCVLYVGGRSSQAIVEAALNAARSLVKDRLSGKSGGSDYSRQVLKCTDPFLCLLSLYLFFLLLLF